MMLTMQERLKDLRVERGLTLEQTGLSRSALGSYESDEFKDISHYVLVKLAKFYGVTADYLLGLAETRNHPNAERLSDVMIELLQSGRIDNALLCDLATYPDFPRLMAELEVYVNGMAVKLVRTANSIVDAASANIVKQYDPGASDPYLRQLVAAQHLFHVFHFQASIKIASHVFACFKFTFRFCFCRVHFILLSR